MRRYLLLPVMAAVVAVWSPSARGDVVGADGQNTAASPGAVWVALKQGIERRHAEDDAAVEENEEQIEHEVLRPAPRRGDGDKAKSDARDRRRAGAHHRAGHGARRHAHHDRGPGWRRGPAMHSEAGRRVQHVRLAMVHLRAAGLNEVADRLEQHLRDRMRTAHRRDGQRREGARREDSRREDTQQRRPPRGDRGRAERVERPERSDEASEPQRRRRPDGDARRQAGPQRPTGPGPGMGDYIRRTERRLADLERRIKELEAQE